MTVKELKDLAIRSLDAKKGVDILSIDVSAQTIICDYFIICTGTNNIHVKALCDNVTDEFGKIGMHPKTREGYTDGRWIVLDFGDIVLHIFNEETRLFYYLERLWENGDNVERYEPTPEPPKKKPAPKKAATTKTTEKKPAEKKPATKTTASKTAAAKKTAATKKTTENPAKDTE